MMAAPPVQNQPPQPNTGQIAIKGPSRTMVTMADPSGKYASGGFPPYLLYAGIGAAVLIAIVIIVK